jgi:hypothetical protein
MILLYAIQSKFFSLLFYISKFLGQQLFINDILHCFVFASYGYWKIYLLAWKECQVDIKIIA